MTFIVCCQKSIVVFHKNRCDMKMPDIDKQAHFFSGMVLAFTVGLFSDPLWGFLAAMSAGVAKEAWDMSGRGTPDALDMMSTITGGIAGFLLSFIAKI